MTNSYVDVNGVSFTDSDIDRWADEAEAGFPESTLVQDTPTWVKSEPMESHSLRVPAELWSLIEHRAAEKNMTTSEYAREALARSLAS